MAGYTSPLENYYEGSSKSSGGYKSAIADFYPKKTKQQEEDEKRLKQKQDLIKTESALPEKKGTLDQIGSFLGGVGNGIKQGVKDSIEGFKTVANIGDVLSNDQINQQRNDAQRRFLDEDFKAGKIDKNKYQEGLNKIQQSGAKAAEKVKTSTLQTKDRTQIAADVAGAALDVGSLGLTGQATKQVVKAGIKETGKKLARTVAEGAGVGAAYGANNKAKDKGNDTSLTDVATGAGMGAALGAGFGVAGSVANKVASRVKGSTSKIASLEASQAAEDAATRKAAGILDQPQNASETLTTPPGANVGMAVENVRTPKGQTPKVPGQGESRYVSKTLPESDFVDPGTKAKLGASYDKTTNASRADLALQNLDAEGIDNFSAKVNGRLDGKHITDQTVFDAQAAAQALEKQGDPASLQAAADIYNKLSGHLTKAGQTVQAASIMARRTPEGLRFQAQKDFEKAGVEFTPELQQQLKSYIDDIKNAAPKSPEAAIARDNVQYFIASHIPSSASDKIINFWRAGLLTSPTTTAGAIAGNTAQAVQRNLITDPVATLSDMVLSLFTRKRTHAAADLGSTLKGGKEGAKVLGSKQYLKTGFNPLDPKNGEGKFNQPRVTNYGDGSIGKATGAYVNGVYKLMGAADLPFRNAAHAKSLSSMANSEAINQGLKGAEKKAFVQDFLNNPPESAMNTANAEAEKAVFANQTRLGDAATALANKLGPIGHVLIPFAKVPSAVATKVITSTPIGTAHELVKQLVKIKKGEGFDQRAMVKAIGEGTTGVPIIAAGYAYGANGNITGGYPSDPKERDQWDAEGKKPNSIKIGDKWYSLNYIQPFATLLATGAKAAEASKSGLDLGEVISQATSAAGQSVLGQSFLKGLSGAIDAVNNPAAYAGKFAANTASSIVPNFVRAATAATDPLKRDASGVVEGFMSGVPGLRGQLNPKLDENGDQVTNNAGFLDQYANPLKPTPVKNTPDTELNNNALLPASRLKAVRQKEIKQLLSENRVAAAQRKIDEYNQQVAKVIAPYVAKNEMSSDQMDMIDKVFLGQVWVNDKGRPVISSRKDLPK